MRKLENSATTARKFKIYEKHCEICGKSFRRSARISNPPRFCGKECMYEGRVGIKHEKHIIPEAWHSIIRKTYENGNTGKGEIRELSKKIGISRQKIYTFAKGKGWIPQSYVTSPYFWSKDEIRIVEASGHKAPISVQRALKKHGFYRTIGAIIDKRRELRAIANRSGYTVSSLAECMGCDFHKIEKAIKSGKLKTKKAEGFTGDKARYHIKEKDVVEYIQKYLPEININKCDKFWLVDVLINKGN